MSEAYAWTLPPLSEEWTSLWECLHDASLVNLKSDREARCVELRLRPNVPCAPPELAEEVAFRLEGVTHAVVHGWLPWPGPVPVHTESASPTAYEAQVSQYREKARVETLGLEDLTAAVGEEPVEILEARYQRGSAGVVLELEGQHYLEDGYRHYRLLLAAASLQLTPPLELEALLELGRQGWEAWGNRN